MSGFKLHCISSLIRGYFVFESFAPHTLIEQNYLLTAEQPPLEMFQMLEEVQNTSFSLLEAMSAEGNSLGLQIKTLPALFSLMMMFSPITRDWTRF